MRSRFAIVAIVACVCSVALSVAQTAPALGVARTFAVLAGSGIVNTGPSTITGDAGSSPTFNNGLSNGEVTGTNYTAASGVVDQAQLDLTTAYNVAAGQAAVTIPTALGATNRTPGVYNSAAGTFDITGILTLDGGGNPNAVFIFQTASTLNTAAGSSVNLINGAQSRNVFWQVGSTATLGTTTAFVGTIMAFTSITLGANATIDGRALARNGSVTLLTNTITVPATPIPVLTILKTVQVRADPFNGLVNPKAIPGAEMLYTITVSNSGPGVVDINTTVVTDPIPANTIMCVSTACNNPVVTFTCSSCGLSNPNPASVTYSNSVGGGPPYSYSPVPDANGYDAAVTGVRINPPGTFSASPASFTLVFKVKVK